MRDQTNDEFKIKIQLRIESKVQMAFIIKNYTENSGIEI